MAKPSRRLDWLSGYVPELPTPFDADGDIDLTAFTRLCERQLAAGMTAIAVCETAGEASTLTGEEQHRLIRTAVEIAEGRARIIAGAGSNSTARAIELTRRAEDAGADAVLSVVPYYNKPTHDGIRAHFAAIAAATHLPLIVHDAPSRAARALTDDTLVCLARSGCVAGLKDGSGDPSRAARLRLRLPDGIRLMLDDAGALACLSGGDGTISEAAGIAPELCRSIDACVRQGRLQSAKYLAKRLVALQSCLTRQSPAALKCALGLLGVMRPEPRLPLLPLLPLDEAARTQVARALARMPAEDLPEPVSA